MTRPFIPTLKWHLKVLVALLILCTAAFFAISFALQKLPAQYQPTTPVSDTTPWLNR